MSSKVLGESVLLDRYPYDGATIVWPLMISDLKKHVQIEHSEDDVLLEFASGGYLAAAVEEVESRGQVSLVYQKRRLMLDELPSDDAIHVIRGPLVSITVVKYLDSGGVEQTLASTHYRAVACGRSSAVYFKSTTGGITVVDGPGVCWIDMVCGMGTDPEQIPSAWRQIVAEVAAYKYERRDGVAGGGIDEAFERCLDRKIVMAGGVRRAV